MNYTSLKNWKKLTKEERARLKAVYGRTPKITKTLHDTDEKSLVKHDKQREKDEGTPGVYGNAYG